MSNFSAIGHLLTRNPITTQFGEALTPHTMSVEYIQELVPAGNTVPIISAGGNCSATFDGHNVGDILSDAFLQITVPKVSDANASGTCHLVNAAGIACLKNWSWSIGRQTWETVSSELMYVLEKADLSKDRRAGFEIGDYGDSNDSVRTSLATAQQIFVVKLRAYWNQVGKSGTHADALKLCCLGGNAVEIKVNFDEYKNWIFYDLSAEGTNDVWTSQLISDMNTRMSSSAIQCFGRYHHLEKREREFYQSNPMLSIFSTWSEEKNTRSDTSYYKEKIQFNFPSTCIMFALRPSTWNNGAAVAGKVGLKDKFFFGKPDTDTVTDVDFKVNTNSLIKAFNYHPVIMRTVNQRRAFGHLVDLPLYVLPFQDEILKSRNIKSFIDLSRFDNLFLEVKPASANTELFYWANVKNIATTDYGTSMRPFA